MKKTLTPVLASRLISTIAEHFVSPGIPVFMLHRFISADNPDRGHDPAFLDDCLKYLRAKHYNFVSLEQVIAARTGNTPLPERSIAFTMDDGFEDQASVAAPVFLENDCPVTIFLITGMLDGELWPWDDQVAHILNSTSKNEIRLQLAGEDRTFNNNRSGNNHKNIHHIQNWIKTLDATDTETYLQMLYEAAGVDRTMQPPANYQAMSWQQAKQLERDGARLAPHTHSHRILSRLDDSSAEHEITRSWQRLNEELSSPAAVFCYPTGREDDFGSREIDTIRETGLIGAVSTEPTYVDLGDKHTDYEYRLPRFSFPDSFDDFVQYSSWIERAKTQLRR